MSDNRRILVVDDQEDLRLQIKRMLAAPGGAAGDAGNLLAQIRTRLGKRREPAADTKGIDYEVETIGQGKDAYEMVKDSFTDHRPYALIFLDMRMPPGWDGLETATRIRSLDKEVQMVIMTAYADHDQTEIADRVGEPDKLLYLKKPFHPEEIRQLALALTEKWNLNRREKERLILTNRLMRENSFLTRQGFTRLSKTYRSIMNAFLSFLEAHVGAIVYGQGDGSLHVCAASSPQDAEKIVQQLANRDMHTLRPVFQEDRSLAILPLRFTQFDGAIYLEGKNIVFSYEQLRPYLDILAETAREVLMNAFLLQQRGDEKNNSAVAMATGKVAGSLAERALRLREGIAAIAPGPTPEDKDSHAALLREADALIGLGQEVMAFSDPAPLEMTEVDLADPIRAALGDLERTIVDRGINLETHLPDDLKALCDPGQLRMAIRRLLQNAVEALDGDDIAKKEIIVSAWRLASGDKAQIVIHDSGRGIPQQIAAELFSPFVGSGKVRATGLGTTIARRIVEDHHGNIFFESSPHNGTDFNIVLPLQHE